MPTYSTSTGERYTTEQINRKSDKVAKELLELQFVEEGYNFCQKCGRSSGVYLDVSHTVSKKTAKELGMAELCWKIENMEILCRNCHRKKDGLTLWR